LNILINELPVLQAIKDIIATGTYGITIHGYFIRPDDLTGDFNRLPSFATVGLSEDVPKTFGFSSLGTKQASYLITIRFYLAQDILEPGEPSFLNVEESARVISAEVARLLFENPNLTQTAAETGDITAGITYLYLREKEYTGVAIEMPVLQEI
jgi:hypothetical protein